VSTAVRASRAQRRHQLPNRRGHSCSAAEQPDDCRARLGTAHVGCLGNAAGQRAACEQGRENGSGRCRVRLRGHDSVGVNRAFWSRPLRRAHTVVPVLRWRRGHRSRTRTPGPVEFMADRIAARGLAASGDLTARFLTSNLQAWPSAQGRQRQFATVGSSRWEAEAAASSAAIRSACPERQVPR
jgi:hypothetical protein